MQTIIFVATGGDIGPNGMSRQPTRKTFNDMSAALGFNDAMSANLRELDIIINCESDNESHATSKYDYRSSWAVQTVTIDDETAYHNAALAAVTPQPTRKSLITKHVFVLQPEMVIDNQLVPALDLNPVWLVIETEATLVKLAETDDDYDEYDDEPGKRSVIENADPKLIIDAANNAWGNKWERVAVIYDYSPRHTYYRC